MHALRQETVIIKVVHNKFRNFEFRNFENCTSNCDWFRQFDLATMIFDKRQVVFLWLELDCAGNKGLTDYGRAWTVWKCTRDNDETNILSTAYKQHRDIIWPKLHVVFQQTLNRQYTWLRNFLSTTYLAREHCVVFHTQFCCLGASHVHLNELLKHSNDKNDDPLLLYDVLKETDQGHIIVRIIKRNNLRKSTLRGCLKKLWNQLLIMPVLIAVQYSVNMSHFCTCL